MKKLLVLAVIAFSFMSCEKDEINEPEAAAKEVVGTWQLYKDENLESMIDQWTGTEWTYVDTWYQNTREDSVIILEFKADGTFVDRYADVVTANGTWAISNDGTYYFDYSNEDASSNDALEQRRSVNVYCENTFSVVTEGNDRAIYYYKKIGTTECAELINYKVE